MSNKLKNYTLKNEVIVFLVIKKKKEKKMLECDKEKIFWF